MLEKSSEGFWTTVNPLCQLFEFKIQKAVYNPEEIASTYKEQRAFLVEQTEQVFKIGFMLRHTQAFLEETVDDTKSLRLDDLHRQKRPFEFSLI